MAIIISIKKLSTEKIKMYFNSPVSPMYILPDSETNFDNVDLILPIRYLK